MAFGANVQRVQHIHDDPVRRTCAWQKRGDGEPVQQDQRRGAKDGVDGAGVDHGGGWDVAGGEHGQRIRPLPSIGPSQARKGEVGKGMKGGREDKKKNVYGKRNEPRLVDWTNLSAT